MYVGLMIVVLILIDQLTKIGAVRVLKDGSDIAIWNNVFHLHYIENTGAAFGMLGGRQLFLIIVTLIIMIVMCWYYRKLPYTFWGKWARVSFVMIISGAIGNLIDRAFLGYVRDFLYFKLIDFPVFNVADILVVVGVGVLLVAILCGELEEGKDTKEKE